jgi:hemerythrin-like metal-binding protein
MDLIVWTPDLKTGSDHIDEQHKELFRAANRLAEAMWDGKGKDEVEKTIDFLAEYTQYHFSDEEKTMLQSGYPDYGMQKTAHEKFVQDIGNLKAKYHSGEVGSSMAIEVLTGACNWFRGHIKGMDTKLGEFLKNK